MNPFSSRASIGCTLAYNSGPLALANNDASTITHTINEYVSSSACPSPSLSSIVAHPLESVSRTASPSSGSAADPEYKPSHSPDSPDSPEDSSLRVANGPVGHPRQGVLAGGMAGLSTPACMLRKTCKLGKEVFIRLT